MSESNKWSQRSGVLGSSANTKFVNGKSRKIKKRGGKSNKKYKSSNLSKKLWGFKEKKGAEVLGKRGNVLKWFLALDG